AAEAKRIELQHRVSEINVEVRPGKLVRLAVSAGAAVFPHDGTTYETLLAEADHRMYRDKSARRGELGAAPAASSEFAIDPFDATRDADAPIVPLPHIIAS